MHQKFALGNGIQERFGNMPLCVMCSAYERKITAQDPMSLAHCDLIPMIFFG